MSDLIHSMHQQTDHPVTAPLAILQKETAALLCESSSALVEGEVGLERLPSGRLAINAASLTLGSGARVGGSASATK